MQDQNVEETANAAARLLTPREVPNDRFVHTLGQDIRRAAQQSMGSTPTVPFQETVIELRKLVQLLRRTLVPVHPRLYFVPTLGRELDKDAIRIIGARQRRVRWLMLGGVIGSALSFLGVLAALILRRRNGRLRPKKTAGVV
jgi:hypothetical protein